MLFRKEVCSCDSGASLFHVIATKIDLGWCAQRSRKFVST